MDVSSAVRNWLNGAYTNYGFALISNYESAPSSSISYYSSDAPSPNKPELIINYTSSGTYYGNRPYLSADGRSMNCMGYALDINLFIGEDILGLKISEIKERSIDYISKLIIGKAESWMNNNMNSRSWARIASYNSDIGLNQYRVVFRTGFQDRRIVDKRGALIRDYNDIFDTTSTEWNYSDALIDEGFQYHFWHQTNTGVWADKNSDGPSQLIEGVTNPSTYYWWPAFTHRSQPQYYKVDSNGV